jgi:hypothetical protein
MQSQEEQTITLPKELQRFEIIGKSGKINKVINITMKHLEMVK